jgi:plasmid stability protein
MKPNTPQTWQALADALGTTAQSLRTWRAQPGAPSGKNTAAWQSWLANRAPRRGRQTQGEAETMAELKSTLLKEQARKESALASLRELELRMKTDDLVPQAEVSETIIKTLTPLRRLLDALPRLCASQCNPENPMVAELALRNALDERVFAEIQKILLETEN